MMAGLQKLSNSIAADCPTKTGGGGGGETTAKTAGVGKLPWNVVANKGPKKGKGKYPAPNTNTPHVPKDNRPGSSIPPCQLGTSDSSLPFTTGYSPKYESGITWCSSYMGYDEGLFSSYCH